MSNVPSILDPAKTPDPAPKKRRKTVAERRAELQAQLRKLQEKEAESKMLDAIEAGECHDPEAAKKIHNSMKRLSANTTFFVNLGLADQDAIDKVAAQMQADLTLAVNGPTATAE